MFGGVHQRVGVLTHPKEGCKNSLIHAFCVILKLAQQASNSLFQT